MLFAEDDLHFLVEQSDIEEILRKSNVQFGKDNRAGLQGQLHRISAMRDRGGKIFGLAMRIGRHVKGNADVLLDHIHGSDKTILILGQPGSGKTTIVREVARVLSQEQADSGLDGRNVVIVDTSNEIGGDGGTPHSCIGMARRMMVRSLDEQSAVMVECVQNHTPHVMVVDEVGRPKEVAAAGTIKKRGVRVIASAHGDLRGLVDNPELVGLVGGVKVVTLGDEMASRRSAARKTSELSKVTTQRVGLPTFDVIVEVRRGARHEWRVVDDPAKAVDAILNGKSYSYQIRRRDPETGEFFIERRNDG